MLATACMSISVASVFLYSIGKQEEESGEYIPEYTLPDENLLCTMYTMSYIQESSEINDVLFLGDSACQIGVDAARIEGATGCRAFNMGAANLTGIGWEGLLIAFEQYLSHHPKPKILILCLGPNSYRKYDGVFQGPKENFINAFGSERDKDELNLNRSRVLHYTRKGVRILIARINMWFHSMTTINARSYYRWDETQNRVRNGEQRGSLILRGFASPGKDLGHHPISISEFATMHMKRLCEKCSLNNIRIIIRIMPVKNGEIKEDGSIEKLGAYFRELKSIWPNLSVSQPMILNWDDDLFYDNVHLNAQGAERMANVLTVEINKNVK